MPDHPNAPEQRTIDVDVQNIDTRGRTLHGYAAVYNVESGDLGGFREKIAPGAFAGVMDADVRCLLNHDPSQVLGRSRAGTLRLSDEQRGLRFECDLPDSPLGENVREAVKRSDIDGASFRFVVGEEQWDGDTRTVKTVKDLQDVTVATYGAYPDASVELRTRPEPTTTEEAIVPNQNPGAGLVLEDRAADSDEQNVESRIADFIRETPRGEARSLTTSVAISQPDFSRQVFDKLRAASVLMRTGVRTISTDSEAVQFPAITGDVAPGWYDEASVLTPGDPTLSTITATPRKFAHLVQLSNEVIDDAEPSVVELIRDHLLKVFATRLDYFFFRGSGTAPEIRGLSNITGIQTVTGVGTPANLDAFATALFLAESENVTGGLVCVMNPRTYQSLRKIKEATGSAKPLLADATSGADAPGRIYGIPVFLSSQIPTNLGAGTNESVAYVFAPEELYVVNRQPIEIEIDRSRLFNSDMSEIRAKARLDILVPNPKAVVELRGITTT